MTPEELAVSIVDYFDNKFPGKWEDWDGSLFNSDSNMVLDPLEFATKLLEVINDSGSDQMDRNLSTILRNSTHPRSM